MDKLSNEELIAEYETLKGRYENEKSACLKRRF